MENELIKVEGINKIKELTISALAENQKSAKTCMSVGDKLLAEAQSGMTDELDESIKKYLAKTTTTIKTMNERRKPVTQIFDKIRVGFTSLENYLKGGSIEKLQQIRDDYAKKKLAEAELARKEAERKLLIQQTKDNLRSDTVETLKQAGSKAIEETIKTIQTLFSSVTLSNAEEVKKKIQGTSLVFNKTCFKAPQKPDILSQEEYKEVGNKAYSETIKGVENQFNFDVAGTVDEILQKFPSKIAELQRIEEQKKTNAEAAKKAAEELAKKDAENAARKEAERKAQEEKEKQAAALAKNTANVDNLFAQQIAAPVKAKVTKKIEVMDVRGYLNIIQLWWSVEGAALDKEALDKKLKFAITCAEKEANKNDHIIDSPYIKYVDDVKASK